MLENGLESYGQSSLNSYQEAVPGGANNAFPAKDLEPVSGNRKGILPP